MVSRTGPDAGDRNARFLFAAFTPVSIQLAVQNLEPIAVKYSTRRSQRESMFLFIVLVTTVPGLDLCIWEGGMGSRVVE